MKVVGGDGHGGGVAAAVVVMFMAASDVPGTLFVLELCVLQAFTSLTQQSLPY